MKYKLCFLAVLCLFFRASAQQQTPGNTNGNILKGGIAIGSKVPDVRLTNVKGLKINGKTVTQLNLSAFSGKLLILDFWATWCSPCRSMVPVMDSLQKAFGEKIVILPVTYQSEKTVAPVIAAMQRIKPFDLPEVCGDVVLHRLFPHRALPHYVWIDGSGTVRAITEFSEVNAKNISALLSGTTTSLAEKKDLRIPFDPDRPLFLNGNGGDGSGMRYHSILSDYVPGLPAALHISEYEQGKPQSFSVRNVPFTWLCKLAFGEGGRWFPEARVKILSKDSAIITTKLFGQAYEAWQAAGHGYCYELVVPSGIGDKAFPMIRQDLQRMFPQWAVSVEPVRTRCIALVRTDSTDRLKTAGGALITDITPYSCKLQNAHLSQLVMRLQTLYLQRLPYPVVDETGYTGRVDLSFSGKLFDLAALRTELAPYGLSFTERDAVVDMLVIRDSAASLTKP